MPHQDLGVVELQRVARSDLLEAKLRVPVVRPGSVPRSPLLKRLQASDAHSFVVVLAPAGYGKTTMLAQWAARDGRPFAWVSIDGDDNDPVVLTRSVAAALSHAQLVDSSAAPTIRRLTSALISAEAPFVLVLDNVHELRSRESARAVAALAEHIPEGSTLVLAGRVLPRLPIARARAAGRLIEVGVDELALSRREVELLLRGVGVEPEEADVAELTDRTEGWAVGAYLAALALKDQTAQPGQPIAARGDDRFVADYFDFEYLSRLGPKSIRFLTRTAILDRMCGPLCDVLLESDGSASRLESFARVNLFLVPLDRRRGWYRYHHEFREFLLAELERREPELVPELNRRAAEWYEGEDACEAAIPHARATGDFDRIARLVGRLALPACSTGRVATVEGWLDGFDDERRLEQHPTVGVLGAWVHLWRGRPAAAKRWLDAAVGTSVDSAMPDGSRSLEPWVALLRAAMCRSGVEQMRVDAEIALRDLGPSSGWRPAALLLRGVAQLLLGDDCCGDESLAEAAETAESIGATSIQMLALAERCLLASGREDDAGAEALALKARALTDVDQLGDDAMSALAFAASARLGLRGQDVTSARADLLKAQELAPQLTYALPWCSMQTNLELARADLAQLDPPGARGWLSAADEILSRRPRLGTLVAESKALQAQEGRVAELCEGRAAGLTTAELRLLPLLTTHLSFREIAQRFYVSRNTVKTQAISVYRKLNVSSRSEAIARATELGLVHPEAAAGQPSFTPSG